MEKQIQGKGMCERTISLIGNRWSLMIINEFYAQKKPLRFNVLLQSLSPVSSKTLSSKLKELVNYKIIEKKIKLASPVIVTYELTEKGLSLAGVLDSMTKWGRKWNLKEN